VRERTELPAPGDTIVAVATPPGYGGIGIVRLSGPLTRALAEALLGDLPPPGRAVRRRFRDAEGGEVDEGLALFFAAPRSFTGEDVLELHGHGGPVVMELLVARCLELGARSARPGEFSERAFLNDRIDLAQAEAVADLIAAGSQAQARAALRSLSGEFSCAVNRLAARIIAIRRDVEAAIDFAEEDLDLPSGGATAAKLTELASEFAALERRAEQGRVLHDGYTVVIAGRPNAGKSSLLNALSGHDAAIVTTIPGTTRDVLRERIDLDGLPVTLLDTAGLRDGADAIEAEGVRRARLEIGRADRVLYLVDSADAAALAAWPRDRESLPPAAPVSVILTKCDLPPAPGPHPDAVAARISVRGRGGLEALRAHLRHVAGYSAAETGTFSARRRHLEALRRASAAIAAARAALADHAGVEIVAEELRVAHEALGEVTGRFTSEDLLREIFSTFCIGK
jgi:tRNA modification GTPase